MLLIVQILIYLYCLSIFCRVESSRHSNLSGEFITVQFSFTSKFAHSPCLSPFVECPDHTMFQIETENYVNIGLENVITNGLQLYLPFAGSPNDVSPNA